MSKLHQLAIRVLTADLPPIKVLPGLLRNPLNP